MAFDGPVTQHQLGRDAAIAVPPAEKSENPALGWGDRCQWGLEHGSEAGSGSSVPARGRQVVGCGDGGTGDLKAMGDCFQCPSPFCQAGTGAPSADSAGLGRDSAAWITSASWEGRGRARLIGRVAIRAVT